LLIRELGSLLPADPVFLLFMPHMRAQKDARLDLRLPEGLDSVTGAASVLPGLAAL